ncbi:hypothetical protein HBB16_15610 [Pseudonocardia sp. MCCB 268]|nr:hypothetical protein [Pseudonocardia cytotoxica]
MLAALSHPVRVGSSAGCCTTRGTTERPGRRARLDRAALPPPPGLTHAGLVRQDGRGSYRIAPRAVVPHPGPAHRCVRHRSQLPVST